MAGSEHDTHQRFLAGQAGEPVPAPSDRRRPSYRPGAEARVNEPTCCPVCRSGDYMELDPEEEGWEAGDPPVYRCEECGEEWA